MPRPVVSVVVPTYNRLEWLPAAITSIQDQTFRDWELILIDDGSTDETERWARDLNEPRLRYVRREHDGRIAAVRNLGVRGARGDWIAFLDSDDRWMPDKLARQLARLQEAIDARWCYAKYQMITTNGAVAPQPHGSPWRPFEGAIVDRVITTEAAVLTQTLLVSADLARELMFDERLPLAEDYDFVLRLAAVAVGCVVDDVLAEIRIHETRTTSLSGPFDGYLGKLITYRKAARALHEAELRHLARRQFRSHLVEFVRRAVRHGNPSQIARMAVAVGRA
jgi:glycosyltransferase involved in cell wall biosynthesis